MQSQACVCKRMPGTKRRVILGLTESVVERSDKSIEAAIRHSSWVPNTRLFKHFSGIEETHICSIAGAPRGDRSKDLSHCPHRSVSA